MIVVNEVNRAGHSQNVDERGHTQEDRVARASGEGDERERDASGEACDPEDEHRQADAAQTAVGDREADDGAEPGEAIEGAFPFVVESDVVDGRSAENHAVHAHFATVRDFVDHSLKVLRHLRRKGARLDFDRVGEPTFGGDFANLRKNRFKRLAGTIGTAQGDDQRRALSVGADERSLEAFADFAILLGQAVGSRFGDFRRGGRRATLGAFIRLAQDSFEARPRHDGLEVARFVTRRRASDFRAGRVKERLRRHIRNAPRKFADLFFRLFRLRRELEFRLEGFAGRDEGEVVDRLFRDEFLREEFYAVVVDRAAFPTYDDVAFEGELLQIPFIVPRLLELGGKPVFDGV